MICLRILKQDRISGETGKGPQPNPYEATTLKEEISSFKSEIAEMKEGPGLFFFSGHVVQLGSHFMDDSDDQLLVQYK